MVTYPILTLFAYSFYNFVQCFTGVCPAVPAWLL